MQNSMRAGAVMPCAMTVAGSDSGGGAGIQADLRVFAALGVFGTSAIAAITAQNTKGVFRVDALPVASVLAQIDAVMDDFPIASIKTGMLATSELVLAVAQRFRELQKQSPISIVVDPVMVAKGGASLLQDDAIKAVRESLLPCARVVTPNLPEAAALLGIPADALQTVEDQRHAARRLVAFGAEAALVKGGHSKGDPVDVLYCRDVDHAGEREYFLTASRIETRHTHGTGCTYAAAIAAYLARGYSVDQAVKSAHVYVQEAIRQAPNLGAGHGPLHHMHPWYPSTSSHTASSTASKTVSKT